MHGFQLSDLSTFQTHSGLFMNSDASYKAAYGSLYLYIYIYI